MTLDFAAMTNTRRNPNTMEQARNALANERFTEDVPRVSSLGLIQDLMSTLSTLHPLSEVYDETLDASDSYILQQISEVQLWLRSERSSFIYVGYPYVCLGFWKLQHVQSAAGHKLRKLSDILLLPRDQTLIFPQEPRLRKKMAGALNHVLDGLTCMLNDMLHVKATAVTLLLWDDSLNPSAKVELSMPVLQQKLREVAFATVQLRSEKRDELMALMGALSNAASAFQLLQDIPLARDLQDWSAFMRKVDKEHLYTLSIQGFQEDEAVYETHEELLPLLSKTEFSPEERTRLLATASKGIKQVKSAEEALEYYLNQLEPCNGLALSNNTSIVMSTLNRPISQLLVAYMATKIRGDVNYGDWLWAVGYLKLVTLFRFDNRLKTNQHNEDVPCKRRDELAGAFNDMVKSLGNILEKTLDMISQTTEDVPADSCTVIVPLLEPLSLDRTCILALEIIRMCMSRRLEKLGTKAFIAALSNCDYLLYVVQKLFASKGESQKFDVFRKVAMAWECFKSDPARESFETFEKICVDALGCSPDVREAHLTLLQRDAASLACLTKTTGFSCVACLDEFSSHADVVIGAECGHGSLCRQCAPSWIGQDGKGSCPICRAHTSFQRAACSAEGCNGCPTHIIRQRFVCDRHIASPRFSSSASDVTSGGAPPTLTSIRYQ